MQLQKAKKRKCVLKSDILLLFVWWSYIASWLHAHVVHVHVCPFRTRQLYQSSLSTHSPLAVLVRGRRAHPDPESLSWGEPQVVKEGNTKKKKEVKWLTVTIGYHQLTSPPLLLNEQ